MEEEFQLCPALKSQLLHPKCCSLLSIMYWVPPRCRALCWVLWGSERFEKVSERRKNFPFPNNSEPIPTFTINILFIFLDFRQLPFRHRMSHGEEWKSCTIRLVGAWVPVGVQVLELRLNPGLLSLPPSSFTREAVPDLHTWGWINEGLG